MPDTPSAASHAERSGLGRVLALVEDRVLALCLAGILLLPLLEILLRRLGSSGLPASTSIVQHLTLAVGVLGGVVAAREGRLLALSTVGQKWGGTVGELARGYGQTAAALVALCLCLAGIEFVGFERESGKFLVGALPLWVLQALLPVGFGLLAVHLWWGSGQGARAWRARLLALLAGALLLAWLAGRLPFDPEHPSALRLALLFALFVAGLFGAPIFALLGGSALVLFFSNGDSTASLPLDHYALVTNPSLPSIPLFTLAGFLLAEGGASKRLIRLFQTWLGGMRGGPAVLCALTCAFFTSFTGASGVTILALGGLLLPILLEARMPERAAVGLITGAGSLGLLFPPCLPLILYAIVAKVDLSSMFLGGVLPGFLLVGLTIAWGMRQEPPRTGPRPKFQAREARQALWSARYEVLIPVVACVSLFSGWCTTLEAAAFTALYALLTQTLFSRDLGPLRDLPRVFAQCGLVVGGVLLILGVAKGLTNYLVDAGLPEAALEWVTASIENKLLFLLLLNLFLLAVGALMDIFSAIVVVVPILVPMGVAFGIDPVHLGVIFLANLELGYLTPPVGMNLFLASYRLNKPMGEVVRATLPMLLILLVGVLAITYLPFLSTALPGLFAAG